MVCNGLTPSQRKEKILDILDGISTTETILDSTIPQGIAFDWIDKFFHLIQLTLNNVLFFLSYIMHKEQSARAPFLFLEGNIASHKLPRARSTIREIWQLNNILINSWWFYYSWNSKWILCENGGVAKWSKGFFSSFIPICSYNHKSNIRFLSNKWANNID